MATPAASVTAVVTPPAKVTDAPFTGPAKVTVAPLMTLLLTSVTRAFKGLPKADRMVVVWPDPLTTEMLDGSPGLLVKVNEAGVSPFKLAVML